MCSQELAWFICDLHHLSEARPMSKPLLRSASQDRRVLQSHCTGHGDLANLQNVRCCKAQHFLQLFHCLRRSGLLDHHGRYTLLGNCQLAKVPQLLGRWHKQLEVKRTTRETQFVFSAASESSGASIELTMTCTSDFPIPPPVSLQHVWNQFYSSCGKPN